MRSSQCAEQKDCLQIFPLPAAMLQDALTWAGCIGKAAVKEESKIHKSRPGFSGVKQPPQLVASYMVAHIASASCDDQGVNLTCPAATKLPCVRLSCPDSTVDPAAGFFFGVRRAIQQWAYDEDHLFDPSNRLFQQEQVH